MGEVKRGSLIIVKIFHRVLIIVKIFHREYFYLQPLQSKPYSVGTSICTLDLRSYPHNVVPTPPSDSSKFPLVYL